MRWLEHLSLDNETGLDPPRTRVRAVPGLVATDSFAPGYFVWAILIENLACISYEGKNMYMATYDWRLSFQNTEVNSPPPMGGGGGPGWCAKHVKAIMNIGSASLGVPKAVDNSLSVESNDPAFIWLVFITYMLIPHHIYVYMMLLVPL
ncbi:phospholipid:diacylglycerol acyltransferase 2 [Olea europaea subsp. europaea]|uniref:Phospholipid:diacylglycerol acyltransferase 2 n=1 Tax=Olea europaea subsp. europaea TaxID=158383 RepID=A0A8S0U941_OLEEU|nr:phospholipid:diacylglycerol acyltransferase 2 [Olea europaea subsp. europaea]